MSNNKQTLVTREVPHLQALAAQITAAHADACRAAQSAIAHARRAGGFLIEAKAGLGHGSWLSWLAEHCPTIAERTAQAYMRVARDWPTLEAKAQRVADLPLRDALALLAEGAESHVEDDADDRLNPDVRNDWTSEFRDWFELIESVRKTLVDTEQDFNTHYVTTYVDTYGTNSAEAREFMRAVTMKLFDIEVQVARIRCRPKPTRRSEVVADETGIRTKLRDLEAALGGVIREALEPSEELRQLRAGKRLIEQANALMSEAQEMTTGSALAEPVT